MALARLALKNLQQKWSVNVNNVVEKQRWCSELVRRFSTDESVGKSEKKEVAVSESGKKSKLFPRRRRRANLWRRNNPDFAPALFGITYSALITLL